MSGPPSVVKDGDVTRQCVHLVGDDIGGTLRRVPEDLDVIDLIGFWFATDFTRGV